MSVIHPSELCLQMGLCWGWATGDGFGVRAASCLLGAVLPHFPPLPTARELHPILCSMVVLPRVTASSKNKQITASFRAAGERKESWAGESSKKGMGEKGTRNCRGLCSHTHRYPQSTPVSSRAGLWEPSQPADPRRRVLNNPKMQRGSLWLWVLTKHMAGGLRDQQLSQ